MGAARDAYCAHSLIVSGAGDSRARRVARDRWARAALACGWLWAVSGTPARSQPPETSAYFRAATAQRAPLRRAVRDAGSDTLVCVVASHPDDLWVLPAAYFRFKLGWRVAALLATRGEGGQNSRGPETGDELGRIRTLEAEACASRLGVRVVYLNRHDGGFCRTAAEALESWGRRPTIDGLASHLRSLRPDVVLTVHDPSDEHGHDKALLEVLPVAVRRAARPDFADGQRPHRVRRVFRVAAEGEVEGVTEKLPVYELDRPTGMSYRRLAYAALKEHVSQEPIESMDRLMPPLLGLVPMPVFEDDGARAGPLREGLRDLFDLLPGGRAAAWRRDFESLETLVGGGGDLVRKAVELRAWLTSLTAEPESELALRIARRREALDRVIVHGAGLRIDAEVPRGAVAVFGRPLEFHLRLQSGSAQHWEEIRFESMSGGLLDAKVPGDLRTRLSTGEPFLLPARYVAPPLRGRYEDWLQDRFTASRYEPPVRLRAVLRLMGQDVEWKVVVPVDVRPAVELELIPQSLLVAGEQREVRFSVLIVRNGADPIHGRLVVRGPPGFLVPESPAPVAMDLERLVQLGFRVVVPRGLEPGVYNLHVRLGDRHATLPLHRVDLRISPRLEVGLIKGVDNASQDALRGMLGNRLHLLAEEDLAVRTLEELDTILIDIRALRQRARNGLWKAGRAAFPRLLDYVRAGGRLVVFYHKDSEYNLERAGFRGWPYPLHVGKGRVTHEDAPVEMLENHPLLLFPNRIRAEDWDGWVQERGLYFPDRYAEQYDELLRMADPGQPVERGALLYARYGEGDFVYCALALFRQLKNLHPGACRLLANLVSPVESRKRR